MRNNANFRDTNKTNRILLTVFDTCITNVVIAPIAIGYWRGTWILSNYYIFSNDLVLSLAVSWIAGTTVQIFFTFAQTYLTKKLDPEKHRISFYTISRLYTYLYGLACVNAWRGSWNALDYFCGTDVVEVIVPTVISFMVLIFMKTKRNLLSIPYIMCLDRQTDYFYVQTMFKLPVSITHSQQKDFILFIFT